MLSRRFIKTFLSSGYIYSSHGKTILPDYPVSELPTANLYLYKPSKKI